MEGKQIPLQRTWVNDTHINFHRILGSSLARFVCVHQYMSNTVCVHRHAVKKLPFFTVFIEVPKVVLLSCSITPKWHQQGTISSHGFGPKHRIQSKLGAEFLFCFVLTEDTGLLYCAWLQYFGDAHCIQARISLSTLLSELHVFKIQKMKNRMKDLTKCRANACIKVIQRQQATDDFNQQI